MIPAIFNLTYRQSIRLTLFLENKLLGGGILIGDVKLELKYIMKHGE